jgi:hypothetical protein
MASRHAGGRARETPCRPGPPPDRACVPRALHNGERQAEKDKSFHQKSSFIESFCGLGQMTQDTYGKPYLHTFLASRGSRSKRTQNNAPYFHGRG